MYEVFSDWIKCSALAMSNACDMNRGKIWDDREKEYIVTMQRYTEKERKLFVEMLSLLTMSLEEHLEDVLGWIYMASGMGSKAAGQFFTPYHLSELVAEMSLPEPEEDGKYRIYEPSCGGGGMIIAAVAALKKAWCELPKKCGGGCARFRLERCIYVLFTTWASWSKSHMCTRRYTNRTV